MTRRLRFDYFSVIMWFSQVQRVFIVEQYFASRSNACVDGEFRSKYADV